ncbi:MAG TPA: efflux transporter outer membrane subunit [Tepidisphaeraceae bacterium]|jgi:NodT family efflux transporter outer membrane factor (OMF) lipoprotein|nr:efflux transporter outer membrane subunit [Tepidisphaeraceae bacterium]
MKSKIKFRFALLLMVLSGCEVGPDYRPPKMKVAPSYGDTPATQPASSVSSNSANMVRWWRSFNDPELDSLVNRAEANNLDLRSAESRLLQARAQRGVVGSELWPQINADGGYQHARGSKNVVIPLGAFTGGKPLVSGAGPVATPDQVTAAQAGGPESPLGNGGFPGVTTDLYQAGFDASWEIDVFGGQRRAIEAANADTAAALEDRRDIMVSLVAEVARNYIQLRTAQLESSIAEQNLHDQQDTLDLTRSRYQAGFATELDVARQAAQVASTAATLPAIEAQVRQFIHALGVLLGQDPESLSAELSTSAPIPPVPPQVPIGVPADLLRRRPDIRRAERQLAAASARIGVATADFYPKFSLTGSFGLDSSQIKQLFDWNSRYFALSPGISWPIFDAGRIRSNVEVQKELTRQAATSYESAVLNAMREVEDSLASYRTEQLRRKSLADAVDESRQAADLARQQYEKGVVDFLEVLDAQRTLLEAQDVLAQSDSAISLDLVSLYKALGGGWQTPVTQ